MFAVRARTSPPRQMCHPAEHRSTAAHPFPDALAVSSSPVVAHEDVAVRPGDGKIPAAVHPPPHAAMFGNVVMLANASRVPSAHPIGDVGSWQIPPLQISLPVHACPQLPQFARSLPVVTHVPLQSVVPGGHDIARHVAPMQTCPKAQTVPHAPQFAESVLSATHAAVAPVPHMVVPAGHEHAPALQSAPATQALPHDPQFARSVASVTSQLSLPAPLQSAVPAAQVDTHALLVQVSVARHAFPQAPQFAASLAKFTHDPVEPVPHGDVPAGHAQLPLAHDCPPGQTFPHEPQLLLSVDVATSQPSAPSSLQSAVPAAQFELHEPSAHVRVAPQA